MPLLKGPSSQWLGKKRMTSKHLGCPEQGVNAGGIGGGEERGKGACLTNQPYNSAADPIHSEITAQA